MDESKGDIAIENKGKIGGLNIMEFARGFAFPTFPLMNPIVMSEFRQEWKVRIYIKALYYDFGNVI